MNSYSYASNNPIARKDPTGRQYTDFNAGFAFPQCRCGPTGGFYVVPGSNDPIVYFGIGVSYRPGPSGSVTYSPTGSPTEGWSNSVNGFAGRGVGGQVGTPQNGSIMPSWGIGIGTPGVGGGMTYSIQLSKLLYILGGPLENVTTPMTIGPNMSSNNSQQNFGSFSRLTGGGSPQERATVISAYNSSVGATTNESKLWTTPNGTVITWSGQIVSPAPQSTPATIKK